MAHIPPPKNPMPAIDPEEGPSGIHMLAPDWEKPKDLKEANLLLSKFRQSHTKKQFHDLFYPKEEVEKVIQQAQVFWSEMLQEALDDLMENGKYRAGHFILTHNKKKPDYREVVYHKLARFTISRTMANNKKDFWIKKLAMTTWIDRFLPKFDRVLFRKDVREGLKLCIKKHN